VLNLGRHLEALEKWEEASTCYRHAIEVEAGVEEFYRHLIICYHNLGLRAEALSTYERCRSALSAVHGNQLSAEMESIRRMLRFE
jgi:tetratricopeptide (TPR) repeat protein